MVTPVDVATFEWSQAICEGSLALASVRFGSKADRLHSTNL